MPFSYQLQNGDVVSVLTGDGQPATDWMRYAKIRSTRSKLRSFFRCKQKQNLRDAGEILLMEFLKTYANVMKESSFLEGPFDIPTTVDDMNQFLPGKTNYQDVDDLLIEIGSMNSGEDDSFLRMVMAKIFLVPQKTFANTKRHQNQVLLSDQMLNVVNKKRKNALDVGFALDKEEAANHENSSSEGDDENDHKNAGGKIITNGTHSAGKIVNGSPTSFTTQSQSSSINASDLTINGFKKEIADPDHVCPYCLPISGDEIIGTRPHGMDRDKFVTSVHRSSCEIVLKSKIEAQQKRKKIVDDRQGTSFLNNTSLRRNGQKIKTSLKTKLKQLSGYSSSKKSSVNGADAESNPQSLDLVHLVWDDSDSSYVLNEKILFLAEISLICEDRKLLLADCSEVVSDMSEIVKTGSLSTNEHAMLNFLVKVESLDHLQKLMNSLSRIESVMSVERRFGSHL